MRIQSPFPNPKTQFGFIKALFCLVVLFGIADTAFAQNLGDYQQQAAQNNPALKAKFQNYLSALEERSISGTFLDPEVGFAYFISPIETRLGPQQAKISVTQMFPWFGTLGNQKTIAETNAKVRFEEFRESRNQLFLQIENLWVEMFEAKESIRLAEENLAIVNTLVEVSLRKYETAQVSQVDVLRAQIEQEDLQTNIALLKDNLSVLEQRFREKLNADSSSEIILPDSLAPITFSKSREALNTQLVHQNPGLNRLRYQEVSSKEMISLVQKNGTPTFGVGLDYIFTGERSDMPTLSDNGKDAIIARASFKIPIFRKKYSAEVRQAESNLTAVQSQIISTENSLQTSLDASLRDYHDASRRYTLYATKNIQRIYQALNILLQNYATDSSNFEEILRMERKLFDYQLKQVQALSNQHKAVAYLNYLTGKNNITPNKTNFN